MPLTDERVIAGFLTSHGALVVTDWLDNSQGYNIRRARLHEWRDGALIFLTPLQYGESVRVAGDFAIWNDEGKIFRRDLAAGTTLELGTAWGSSLDVAANGDVVWSPSFNGVRRYRGGITETIPSHQARGPVTDGSSVLWWQESGAPTTGLHGVGPTGDPFGPLPDPPPMYSMSPHTGYAIDGGWIAYMQAEEPDSTARDVWRRTPTGAVERVSRPATQTHYLLGVDADGEILYRNTFRNSSLDFGEYLAVPGESPVRIATAPDSQYYDESKQGYGDFVFHAGTPSRWYKARDGSLQRLQHGDAPVQGSQTTFTSATAGIVDSSSAHFAFASTVPGATFACRFGGGAWQACSSPFERDDLADGPYELAVRSVEPGGDVDPEPASQRWIVDTAAPVTTLTHPAHGSATNDTTPPAGGTAGTAYGDGSVTVEIRSSPGGALVRTLESAPAPNGVWLAFVEPELPEGLYTVRARQTDVAGNVSESEERAFRVDVTEPSPPALVAPAHEAVVGPRPTFTWAETTDVSGIDHYELFVVQPLAQGLYQARLEDCPGGTCSASPDRALADGLHRWEVRAVDRADNTVFSAQRDVTVDATPPAPFALAGPADGARTADTTPTVQWAATDDALAGLAGYDVFVDGERVAAGIDATELTLPALADGAHTWRVVAIDTVGNERASAVRTVEVDTTAPVARVRAVPNPVLAASDVVLDASGSTDADAGALVRHEWDLDGDGTFDRDTGPAPTTTTSYPALGQPQPAVRVTDEVGHTSTASVDVSVRRVPPLGFPGVSINGGDRYTNDPDVVVSVVWLPLASNVVLSNDGGFGDAQTFLVDTAVPWTLDSSGIERLPRTIYARFTGADGARETYQDDIVLDQTAPQLLRATRVGRRRLRLRARDNVSGVARMQLATNRRRPGATRRYRRVTTLRATSRPVFVRVRDRAGNWSRWKRAARRG